MHPSHSFNVDNNCISCAHSLSAIHFCLYIRRQLQFPSSFLQLLFLLLPIISPASFKHPHVLVKCFFYWILTTWVVKWKAPTTSNRIISCLHLAILFWIWPLCLWLCPRPLCHNFLLCISVLNWVINYM